MNLIECNHFGYNNVYEKFYKFISINNSPLGLFSSGEVCITPNAVWSEKGLTRGKALLGKFGKVRASVAQAVHDGDTVKVEADGNISVRFLGVDTPEISFQLPNTEVFRNIYPHFQDYLTDPFAEAHPDSAAFSEKLGKDLVAFLRRKIGLDCAQSHFQHAKAAEKQLQKLIQRDVAAAGSPEKYRFFLAFASEIMDRYGRFLCFLHQDLPPTERKKRRESYNEEMLKYGVALPYFIFPNVNPFRPATSIYEAIKEPRELKDFVEGDKRLTQSRNFVRTARKQRLGIFQKDNPLLLEPFELRFLARRQPPDRWVIDMTKQRPALLKPTNYCRIPNPEDRLFIPAAYVPAFHLRGYRVEALTELKQQP